MRYHGKKGSVKLGGNVVLSLNSWTYDAATDKADVTCFGYTNKQYVTGLPDVKGSLAGVFDDLEPDLFAAAEGGVPVLLDLIPVSTVTGKHWSGQAYVDASIDCPANGPITVSCDWVAAGPWTRTWTVVTATGATAGSPGTFTPAGADAPANLAAMTGITASPTTAGNTGPYVTLAGATAAHSPGTFTPAGADAPANLAAMTGITASPTTAWTTGQYVTLADATAAHWSSSAWVAGIA